MCYILKSAILPIKDNHDDEIKNKITLLYQFFIHPNEQRNKEILFCLKKNVENPHIDTIYLLNERIYSTGELGGIISDAYIAIV